jgi:hypothetical protein
MQLKPNYFKKQYFFVIIFFTKGNNRGAKWQWSTQQDSSMHLIHGTSLVCTPLPLLDSIITLGKKNDDEKTLLLKIIWL